MYLLLFRDLLLKEIRSWKKTLIGIENPINNHKGPYVIINY